MGSNKHTMKLLIQTCLSLFICLASAAPSAPKWEPLSNDLKNCKNKFLATVSVKDVPKFDKKSGTDLYFKVYSKDGDLIHRADAHRDIGENMDEYLKFKPFEINAGPQDFLEIELKDEDKGVFNRNDVITKARFTIQRREEDEQMQNEQIADGQFCNAVIEDANANDVVLCWTNQGKFGNKNALPFMLRIEFTCNPPSLQKSG